MEAIANHWAYLQRTGSLQDHLHRNSRQHLLDIIQEELLGRLLRQTTEAELDVLVRRIADRELDPYTAAEMLLQRVHGGA